MDTDIFLPVEKQPPSGEKVVEVEILKNFIATIDYYLGEGNYTKVNNEMNIMCKYILKKEGMEVDELPFEPDILSGFKKRIRMGMDGAPFVIPHTKYEHYKRLYSKKNVNDNTIASQFGAGPVW